MEEYGRGRAKASQGQRGTHTMHRILHRIRSACLRKTANWRSSDSRIGQRPGETADVKDMVCVALQTPSDGLQGWLFTPRLPACAGGNVVRVQTPLRVPAPAPVPLKRRALEPASY